MVDSAGFAIVSDVRRVAVEESDFPVLCETCLGDSPYIRMVKERLGKECRICSRPYTGFRWRPGLTARFKTTIVCQGCAKLKNVCQTCLFDLEFGLPVQVRDKFLKEAGADLALNIPESRVGRDFVAAYQINQSKISYGHSEEVQERLARFARYAPYYKRNRPRICTFWQRGECKRGKECPYLHEDPDYDESLANQNIRDRFLGVRDPVAEKILRQRHDTDPANQIPVTNVTTLYVDGVQPPLNEIALFNHFSKFGNVKTVKMVPLKSCSFVTFENREGAENAIQNSKGNVLINGMTCRVAWGKPKPDVAAAVSEDNRDMFGAIKYESMNPRGAELLK